MKSGIKLLTLNCWGLPLLTPQKKRRLDAITETIRTGNWDVVALQEVWLRGDQERLIKNSGFQHHVIFKGRRFFSSGLILLSRFKILAHDFHDFVVKGFPHRLHEGDFHASKGIGYALVESPLGNIPIFVTHLIAKYSRRYEHDINRVFRIAQILELILFIRKKAMPGGFILCGDLNAEDQDLEIEALHALTGLKVYSGPGFRTDRKLLDHIISGASLNQVQYKIFGRRLVFRKPIKNENIRYSDHHGLFAEIRPGTQEVEIRNTKRVLERTLRYLIYSIKYVRKLDRQLGWIPLMGWLSRRFMEPQFKYIDALLAMLEADLKQSDPEHPLRLRAI